MQEVEKLPVEKIKHTIVLTVTFPANLPANQKTPVSMQLDPALGTVTQQQVPLGEAWVTDDFYISAAQATDAIFTFLKNLLDKLHISSPLNGNVVTNVARPKMAKKVLKGGDILTIEAQNLTAIGAAAVTDTAYLDIVRFKG